MRNINTFQYKIKKIYCGKLNEDIQGLIPRICKVYLICPKSLCRCGDGEIILHYLSGPMCDHMCPYKNQAEGDLTAEEEKAI